jgi:hypothetical protein
MKKRKKIALSVTRSIREKARNTITTTEEEK